MIAIPENIRLQLLENGREAKAKTDFDPKPVLKLFAPWCGMTWLISEMSPDNNDVLFGLADLEVGEPEVGAILLSDLASMEGPGGLQVEADRFFVPQRTLNQYASAATLAGKIVL